MNRTSWRAQIARICQATAVMPSGRLIFDEESEAHDAAKLKYLSLTKDSPLETRAYAMQDLSTPSWTRLWHRLHKNATLFNAYANHYEVRATGTARPPCDAACRNVTLADMWL